MKSFVIFIINLYQKYISPYKGYKCAYGVYHQNGTCSTIIKSHIQKYGVIKAYPMVMGQFDACKIAYLYIQEESNNKENEKDENSSQGNSCYGCIPGVGDCGVIDACDVGSCFI